MLDVPARLADLDPPEMAPRPGGNPVDPLPWEPYTDLGYARRLIAAYGDQIRYVPAWKRWLVWDGRRWALDIDGQVHRYMKLVARSVHSSLLVKRRANKDAIRAARRAESDAGVRGALNLAGTEPEIAVMPDQLDVHPLLLNCRNGVVDLESGELRGHDRALLLTKVTGASYLPGSQGVVFEKFLARVQPDEAMRGYLKRLLGHTLEGRQIVHILPIFYGEGGNGKGTFINGAVLAALGDYADAADPGLLIARGYDAHPTGVADLFGLRLAVLHESDAGRRLAEATVKRLTGGDRLKARRMREDFWGFNPTHTFVMLTNHRPIVGGTDEGIWRRLRLVPWEVVIPPEERDEEMPGRLARELDAVLTWLIAGCLEWRVNGLGDPERVTKATAEFRKDSDALARFLDERCLIGHGTAGSTELYRAWDKWCSDQGEDPGTQKAFSTALEHRGYDKAKDGAGRMRWQRLGLVEYAP